MADLPINNRYWKILRLVLAVGGVMLIFIALFAGQLGISEPGTLGIGRLTQLVIGSLLLLTGLLGKRITGFYQGMAVVFLNTLLLLTFLELGAIAIARLGLVTPQADARLNSYFDLPYYREQVWAEAYWYETRLAEAYQYHPYTIWRHQPFVGNQVNISPEGIRNTPGANCEDDAYTVYTFGGSSMWGWGSPDWGTIAAYLQSELDQVIEGPVCVVNLGEDAYVSTQSVITLMLQLQRGNIPDAVIFYDGVNDTYVAYESGQPGSHLMLRDITTRLEEQENMLLHWLQRTRLFWLLQELVSRLERRDYSEDQNLLAATQIGDDFDHLAQSVAARYLGNYHIVSRLADGYGFQYHFFWQPHLAVGEKVLTEHEREIKSEMDVILAALANSIYQEIELASLDNENLWYIADLFDDQDRQIWIDAWGHITPEGNEMVAHKMLAVLETELSKE